MAPLVDSKTSRARTVLPSCANPSRVPPRAIRSSKRVALHEGSATTSRSYALRYAPSPVGPTVRNAAPAPTPTPLPCVLSARDRSSATSTPARPTAASNTVPPVCVRSSVSMRRCSVPGIPEWLTLSRTEKDRYHQCVSSVAHAASSGPDDAAACDHTGTPVQSSKCPSSCIGRRVAAARAPVVVRTPRPVPHAESAVSAATAPSRIVRRFRQSRSDERMRMPEIIDGLRWPSRGCASRFI